MTAKDLVFWFRIDRTYPLTVILPLLGGESSNFAIVSIGMHDV